MLLITKLLLTFVTLGYSAIPSFFDFNPSHATNPSWTGHARYHVVWQVTSYDYIALIMLWITWATGNESHLWVPALMACAIYGGFWTALLSRRRYGGVLQDAVNGVPRFRYNILGWRFEVDANISLFSPITVLTLVTVWIVFGLAVAGVSHAG